MKEVLTINVQIAGMSGMERKEGNVNMICFIGSSNCRNFQGKIMDDGVDTQVLRADGSGALSARYLMEGMDCEGKPCKLYVENNGTLGENGNITTTPKILTNSSALKWLETAELSGTVEGAGEGKILIRIYERNSEDRREIYHNLQRAEDNPYSIDFHTKLEKSWCDFTVSE